MAFTSNVDYTKEELLSHKAHMYCPEQEELRQFALKYPETFCYEKPCLLSVDHRILYGFSAENLEELEIPDEVEIYDNVCLHSEEEENEYYVDIGRNLREIVDTYLAFGLHVLEFYAYGENPYFCTEDGILYNKDRTRLVLFPSGRTTVPDELSCQMERSFVMLPETVKTISKDAFQMMYLPDTLVIPDSVTCIEKGAFFEFGPAGVYAFWGTKKRYIILPERFKDVIDGTWKSQEQGRKLNIMYY